MKKNTQKAAAHKKSSMSMGKMAAIGAGVAAASAGAYYFLGPKGKAHQKQVSAVMTKMKKEVESKAKKAKGITVPLYHKTVDTLADTYSEKYKGYEKEIKALAATLKNEWKGTTKKGVKKSTSNSKRKAAK